MELVKRYYSETIRRIPVGAFAEPLEVLGRMEMELQVKLLCKRYGRKEALQDVSFTLQKGIYGLLGENGAGSNPFKTDGERSAGGADA